MDKICRTLLEAGTFSFVHPVVSRGEGQASLPSVNTNRLPERFTVPQSPSTIGALVVSKTLPRICTSSAQRTTTP